MTPPNLSGMDLAAWHRSEAERIEAEERARRPELAAGQVWREPESDTVWIACVNDYLINPDSGGFWSGARSSLEYLGLARDVLRVVPPDPKAVAQPRTVYLGEEWRRMGDDEVIIEGDLCAIDDHPIPHHQHWWENFPGTTVREAMVLAKDGASLRFFRKVQPDPPAPQVAPEPTGAELVGRRCWVRHDFNNEWQDRIVQKYDPADAYCYGTHPGFPPYASGSLVWWKEAKPYVEGVAP